VRQSMILAEETLGIYASLLAKIYSEISSDQVRKSAEIELDDKKAEIAKNIAIADRYLFKGGDLLLVADHNDEDNDYWTFLIGKTQSSEKYLVRDYGFSGAKDAARFHLTQVTRELSARGK